MSAAHVGADGALHGLRHVYVLKLRHTGTPNIGGGEGALIGKDVSFTLATGQDQTLFAHVKGDSTPKGGELGDPAFTLRDCESYIVRRLTPVECERLQGFPDGHTDVPYRGKEHPADGPRYKALGNSMAVPVIRWIGERMQAVDGLLKGNKHEEI